VGGQVHGSRACSEFPLGAVGARVPAAGLKAYQQSNRISTNLLRLTQINVDVEREVLNHRQLAHPFIIKFKKVLGAHSFDSALRDGMQRSIAYDTCYIALQVMLTPTHLVVIMEYASGGELFAYVQQSGRLTEDASRFFFQQLITAVEYCHNSGVYHRDLKLENALIDISSGTIPYLKLCDFGFSKVRRSLASLWSPCCLTARSPGLAETCLLRQRLLLIVPILTALLCRAACSARLQPEIRFAALVSDTIRNAGACLHVVVHCTPCCCDSNFRATLQPKARSSIWLRKWCYVRIATSTRDGHPTHGPVASCCASLVAHLLSGHVWT